MDKTKKKDKKSKKEKKEKNDKDSSPPPAVMKGGAAISKFLLALIDLCAKDYNVPYSEWPGHGTAIFLIYENLLILVPVLVFIERKTIEKYSTFAPGETLDVDWIREKIRGHCWDKRKKLKKKKLKAKGTPEYETSALLDAQFNLIGENLVSFLASQGVPIKAVSADTTSIPDGLPLSHLLALSMCTHAIFYHFIM
jgi:hypothetical protein